MNVTETKSDGLSREYKVVVEKGILSTKLEEKIKELQPQVNLKGFRPGKVPASHIKNMYGKSIMGDIVQEEVSLTSQKALEEKEIRPAAQPAIELESDQEKLISGDVDLEYSMKVDVMPEFEPADVSKLKLEKMVVEATDDEVDEALKRLAETNKKFEARGKTAKARDGDAVVIDFSGKIDGELFDGGTAEGQTVVLGEGRFIPGFEEQLVGAKTNQDVEVKVTFPEDYPAENLAGKEAVFDVKVTEVREPKEAEIDDEFAKGLGIDDLAALKDLLKKNIEQELGNASRQRLKRVLLDALDEKHDFDLPTGMVETEFDQIWRQFEQEKEAGCLDDSEKDKSEDEQKEEYKKIAERRVRLGLVLAEIGRLNEVEIKSEEVSRALNMEAQRYPGQEQQVMEFYQKNPAAMAQLRAPIFEEKVVDYIIERATITEKTVSREELEKALEEE
jgi:trigger factor